MSAARLREAAKVLRERAEDATPGPWVTHPVGARADVRGLPENTSHDYRGNAVATAGDSEFGACPAKDAHYIATMHPGVGLALARALDTAADAFGHADLCLDCFHPTCLTVGELIPVADLILGGQS